MVKVKYDESTWRPSVTAAEKSAAEIVAPKIEKLTKTKDQVFTSMIEQMTQLEPLFEKYRQYSQQETQKMLVAGDNVKRTDEAYAKN